MIKRRITLSSLIKGCNQNAGGIGECRVSTLPVIRV
jgi:hypothetical protein